MRRRLTYVLIAALVLLAAGASSTFAARGSGEVTFVFNGHLLADAGNSSSLYVDVFGGKCATSGVDWLRHIVQIITAAVLVMIAATATGRSRRA